MINIKRILLIVLALAAVLIIAGLALKVVREISNQTDMKPLIVATDPNFTEYEGQLIPGFPEFPVYPGATLKGSARVNTDDVGDQGYRVKWVITTGSVPEIMKWYEEALIKAGWKFIPNNDLVSMNEQVAEISMEEDELEGYIAAEVEDDNEIEIVVDLRKD